MMGFVVPEAGSDKLNQIGSLPRDPETIKLRFASGITYELKNDSVAEYLLAPVFLKFASIFIAIIVILHDRSDESARIGFSKVLLWIGLVGGLLLCLYVFSTVCLALKNARYIKSIYTPLITLPSMVIAEFCVQTSIRFLLDWPPFQTGEFLVSVSKVGAVFILMDILYGSYIAPHHPQTWLPASKSLQSPVVANDVLAPDERQTPEADPDAAPTPGNATPVARTMSKIRITEPIHPVTPLKPAIQVGSERIEIASLVMIKADDHYLQITTTHRSFMVREKLANVVAQLDLDTGVQVNRSCWLARSSIRSAERNTETGVVIVHALDMRLPVARSRVTLLMDCLKRWNIGVNRAMAA